MAKTIRGGSSAAAIAIAGTMPGTARAQRITLRGVGRFDEAHAFTRVPRRFEEPVGEKYDVAFDPRLNGEPGIRRIMSLTSTRASRSTT